MMYFFVDNIIQTGCFSFLEKVAEADFYEQSRRHVCRPSVLTETPGVYFTVHINFVKCSNKNCSF